MKLLVLKSNGELKELRDHVLETEFEHFAECLVEVPPVNLHRKTIL